MVKETGWNYRHFTNRSYLESINNGSELFQKVSIYRMKSTIVL